MMSDETMKNTITIVNCYRKKEAVMMRTLEIIVTMGESQECWEYSYSFDEPAPLSNDLYDIIVKGYLFANDWCQEGINVTWRIV